LVIVTVSGAETCPTTVDGKLKLVAESVSVGAATAVPLKTAVCVPTLSVNVKLPVAAPACVGLNPTVTTHAAPAASELPQVLDNLTNGAVTTWEMIETALPPPFATFTVCATLFVPTSTLPKPRLAGSSVTFAVARPVPLIGINSCPPATFALTTRFPARLPVSVGVNVTFTEQVAFFASATPTHVSVSLKFPAAPPPNPRPETVNVGVPVFFSVTVCAALDEPTVRPAKVSDDGLELIVASAAPAVTSGICHTPRP